MLETTNAIPKDDAVRQCEDSNFFTAENILSAESKNLVFPIEIFPQHLQDYINQAYDKNGFHRSYSGLSLLTAIGTAIGGTTLVRMKENWNISANIWSILVGSPTEAKTHAQKYPFKTFFNEAKKLSNEYQYLRKEYNREIAEWKSSKEEDKGDPPTKPIKKKVIVKDITIERLGQVLHENYHGIVSLQDEMTTFFNNLTRYNTNIKAEYLELWSRGFVSTERIGREGIDIEDPYLLVIGNIQYKSLITFLQNDGDGFFERWLFALPEKKEFLPTKMEDIDFDLYVKMNSLIWGIYKKRPLQPDYLDFTYEFKKQYNEWKNAVKLDAFNNTAGAKESIVGKLTEYVLRFSLIIYKMEKCSTKKVDVNHLKKAIKLYEYFKITAFEMLELSGGVNPLKLIDNKKIISGLKLLPDNFKAKEGFKIFSEATGISRTTFYNQLDNNQLFNKIGRGDYERKY